MNRQARRDAKRVSWKQEFANKENAKFSTGPATEKGKETSKMNALKHGLTAMKPYLPSEESVFLDFAAGLLRRYDAQTADERQLVETIIDVEWRIQRIPSLEARLFIDLDTDPHKTIRSLDTLSRHESRLRKLLLHTVTQLQDAILLRRKIQQYKTLAAQPNANGFVFSNAATETPEGLRAAEENDTFCGQEPDSDETELDLADAMQAA